MKMVVELSDDMKRAVRSRDDGSQYIDLSLIPRWYDLEVIEMVSEQPKRRGGRPKKDGGNSEVAD